ncbi:MAG TPA: hypothetical protein VIV14_04680 [Gammaproteobacteria bacterium]
MDRSVLWLAAGMLAGMAITAHAHHSWGAVYDGGRPVEDLAATIVGPHSRRPHDNIAVMITNEAGEAEGWTVQWRGNRGRDEEREQYDFNHGDDVLITGRIARDEETKQIQMTRLVRPSDGWTITAREGRRRR